MHKLVMPSSQQSRESKDPNLPRVSIVTVNYNGHQWLRLFLPSISMTKYPDYEIIIVDNGSTDQSISYIEDHWKNSVRLIKLKRNFGFAEACNMGVREANGQIIVFLNNDVEVDQYWLKYGVEKLLSNTRAGAVQSKMMQHNRRNMIDCIGLSVDRFGIHLAIGHDELDLGQYDEMYEIGGCCGGAMIVWRTVLAEAGFFDNKFFLYYEDADLSWRIKLAGYKILPAQSSVVYHFGSATSKTVPSAFTTFHLTKNYFAFWLKNSSLATLIMYWPIPGLVITGASFFDLLHGRFGLVIAHLKAVIWVALHIDYILKERYKIQHTIKKPNVNPEGLLFVCTSDTKSSSHLMLRIKKGIFLLKSVLRKA
jgi:GT2 family glycosyltransferase